MLNESRPSVASFACRRVYLKFRATKRKSNIHFLVIFLKKLRAKMGKYNFKSKTRVNSAAGFACRQVYLKFAKINYSSVGCTEGEETCLKCDKKIITTII
jgi:hypothetical protein